jgi:hypothetical protein
LLVSPDGLPRCLKVRLGAVASIDFIIYKLEGEVAVTVRFYTMVWNWHGLFHSASGGQPVSIDIVSFCSVAMPNQLYTIYTIVNTSIADSKSAAGRVKLFFAYVN